MQFRYVRHARPFVFALSAAVVALFVAWSDGRSADPHTYHGRDPHADLRGGGIDLPMGGNTYFKGSGECAGCHGLDTVGAVWANHDASGRDVNPTDGWRSSMMANSARDPFWRAKVSHEVLVNPGHQSELEDKCTSCHAPAGRFNKAMTTGGHYSIGEMTIDPIALDGVSCVGCHMQDVDSLGKLFSGNLKYSMANILLAPHDNLFYWPMQNQTGYLPWYEPKIHDSGLCAGCHTLVTSTADLDGNATGDEFVEQATYHEWLNSAFNTETFPLTGVSCQACHMPQIGDAVIVSALYDFLTPRSPFGLHHLAGANTFMLELLKNNSAALGLTASSAQFDTSIALTNRILQQQTLLLEASVIERDLDTAFIAVKLTNLAGHKFPSGYPARRAFIELTVRNAMDDILFRSGGWNDDYEVIDHDADWEPHYDVIRSTDQAQIYEMVMADVNGNKTTVLERARESLKDNRLAPLGFTTSHPSYDTTLVVGVPLSDNNFNRYDNGTEGSGTDIVRYHVAMNGFGGLIKVQPRVWYQSAPPRYMEEMFAYNSTEIDTFRDMYLAADGSPVLVKEVEITDLSVQVDDLRELGIRIFPNPVMDGLLRIEGIPDRVTAIEVFDSKGAVVDRLVPSGQRNWQVHLPPAAATYVVVVRTADRVLVERVVAF